MNDEAKGGGMMTDKRLEIAYASAKSALELQQASLNNIRNRTVSLLGAAALFISFAGRVGGSKY